MTENLYPEFHIEKLKSIARGWAVSHPEIERICLLRSVSNSAQPDVGEGMDHCPERATSSDGEFGSATPSNHPKDPRYWIFVVGPDELEPLVGDLNDHIEHGWGDRSLVEDLADCFTEKERRKIRYVKDSWWVSRISPEEYAKDDWACENNGYIDEDGNEVPIDPVYFVDPGSELVLSPPPEEQRPAQKTLEGSSAPPRCFMRDGDVWQIQFDGEHTRLKHSKGILFLTYLIEKPNHDFTPVDLTRLVNERGDSGEGKTGLDNQGFSFEESTIDALDPEEIHRLTESAHEIWEKSKAANDPEAQNMWSQIQNILLKEYGISCIEKDRRLSFKPRTKHNKQFERARSNVQKQIKATIDKLRREIPTLGYHLADCVKTGNSISYKSDKGWTIRH